MDRKQFLQTVGGTALASTLLQTTAASPNKALAKGTLKRGVSLYSYQEEFYTGALNLEDCLSEASSIGATEIEFVAEQMCPDFPNPSDKFIGLWKEWIAKYKLNATTYTQFQDTFLTKTHDLNVEEGLKMLERDLKLAKRMGFQKMRLLIGTPIDIVEKGIPLAEKYDIWMGCEVHQPCTLDSKLIQRWIEIAEKAKTKHFGIVPDFGIFIDRPVRIYRERMVRDGKITDSVSKYIVTAWEDGVAQNRVLDRVNQMSRNPADAQYVKSVYATKMEDPNLLIPLAPYIHHMHAKFYEMTEDMVEYQIPYEKVIPVLINAGVNASIVSEYEGQRTIQDAAEPQALEQVRRQHVMLKKLISAS